MSRVQRSAFRNHLCKHAYALYENLKIHVSVCASGSDLPLNGPVSRQAGRQQIRHMKGQKGCSHTHRWDPQAVHFVFWDRSKRRRLHASVRFLQLWRLHYVSHCQVALNDMSTTNRLTAAQAGSNCCWLPTLCRVFAVHRCLQPSSCAAAHDKTSKPGVANLYGTQNYFMVIWWAPG